MVRRTRVVNRLRMCSAATSVLLLVMLVGVGVARSAEANTKAGKQVRIAYLAPILNTFGNAIYLGVLSQAKRSNATVDVFAANFSAQTQFAQVQDLTASGKYDALVITAVDGVSISPAVLDALNDGVKVVAASTPIGPDYSTADPQIPKLTGSVVQPSVPNAGHIADTIAKACKGINPCEVGYFAGSSTYGTDFQRQKALKKFLAKYSNVQLVSLVVTGYTQTGGIKGTQDLLQAHPGVDVIAGSGDQQIQGAALALKEAGVPAGKIKLIGNFASVEGVRGVRDGSWFATVAGLPKTGGKLAAQIAISAVRGLPIKDNGIDISELSPVGPVVTKENADKFHAEYRA